MPASDDRTFMRRALRLARRGLGRTTPNPAVGAVVIRGGQVLGEGYHRRAGTPHAEIHAIRAAGQACRGSTLYVTLEPCNHSGRTPPCTEAILAAGIRKVVIGTLDPNPRVAGGGAAFLQGRGVEVQQGCMEAECRLLVAPFAKHATTGLPWVRSKVACSIDGRTATRTGHSKWITNELSRKYGHRLRDQSDAIVVGRGTVEADDPELSCRGRWPGHRDPIRLILDSGLEIGPSMRVFHLNSPAPTVVIGAAEKAKPSRKEMLERTGAQVWLVGSDRNGRVDLREALAMAGARGIQSVLLEGGGTLQGAFWDEELVDEAFFFFAPIVLGGKSARAAVGGMGAETVNSARRLNSIRHQKLGDNWLVHGLVTGPDIFWSLPPCSPA